MTRFKYKYLFYSLIPIFLYLLVFHPVITFLSSRGQPINSSFPITFYHKAYIDYRTNPPRLRLFSLNPCVKPNTYLLIDVYNRGSPIPNEVKLLGDPFGFFNENCPPVYGPATHCFYVPHTFYGVLPDNGIIEKATIRWEDREIEFAIEEIGKKYERGLTVCLQIVYYYSQWQNVILYIEAWRAQGATRFIVFYHSSTEDTKKVLDYYEKLGLIELRPWPNIGELSSNISPMYPKVDESVFIIATHMALQICSLEIKTSLGIVADFDEVMVPDKGTVLDHAMKEMTGKDIGALLFENTHVALTPNIYTNNYSGVRSLTFTDIFAPPKYIFNTSLIDICETHSPGKFLHKSTYTKMANGTVLHFRFNVKQIRAKIVRKSYRFFPNDTAGHIRNMHDTMNKIFENSPPAFSYKPIETLNKCIAKVKSDVCHSTGGICKAAMDNVTNWVYNTTEGLFTTGTRIIV
ncbi:Glycosyltransferase family 92 protein [Caenorhabditis elegans]|uniref:Glycosyltransferase family 92 protein n=1 Tax=Caenorhabditis elegans TaxID=6239 RepID=Q9XXM0_CAEEL|nr:Glycosyltransferase family 92 protein [Caenorhabditis elegans]CAA18365.1 Glycosyltransferase family 92 protein [Caenorhabditis elegans]|eukprot:NP_492929.1 Biofilm Absent on Head (after Yersinia exposure) [Caenorhabditis elegans]